MTPPRTLHLYCHPILAHHVPEGAPPSLSCVSIPARHSGRYAYRRWIKSIIIR